MGIRERLEKLGVYWHWQNLNERCSRRGETAPTGAPYHGRAWLHVGDRVLGFSWNLWSRFCHASITIDPMDREVTLAAAFPPVAFWLSLEGWPRALFHALRLKYDAYEVNVSVHDASAWWSLWHSTTEWKSSTPRWRHGSFDFADAVLGEAVNTHRVVEERDVEIPMPEGVYEARATMKEMTVARPRWFPRRIVRVDLDVPKGIPTPGKGTQSYNCGDDATFGRSAPARSITQAVGELVGDVLADRVRRGGWSLWRWPADRARVSP